MEDTLLVRGMATNTTSHSKKDGVEQSANSKCTGGGGDADEKVNTGVAALYAIYDALNSKYMSSENGDLEHRFKDLIVAVHGSEKEKRLASQFIARFIDRYPKCESEAVNALFDLCEEADSCIRKQAVKDLVTVCKKLPHWITSTADVFAQIFQTVTHSEINLIHSSLFSLFLINCWEALTGICAQIKDTAEPIVRDLSLKFLQQNIQNLGPELMTPKFEEHLFAEIGKIAKTLNTQEYFSIGMKLLSVTKFKNTGAGGKATIRIIESVLDIKKDLQSDDDETLARLLICTDYAFPFFHEDNSSASLFLYYCIRVLPKLEALASKNENLYFAVLKMTTELSKYIGKGKLKDSQADQCFISVLNVTETLLFDPPEENTLAPPNYKFSFIETLFNLVHKIGVSHPEIVSKHEEGRLKNFRSKVAFLVRAVVAYSIRLREDLQGITNWEAVKNEAVKITCLRTLANISTLSKEMFKKSWKGVQIRLAWTVSSLPKHSERDDHRGRVYKPPGGQYSSQAGPYDSPSNRKGRYNHNDHVGDRRGGRRFGRYNGRP